MPLLPIDFGMTEEERRKRAIEEAMRATSTPGINPNEPVRLPDAPRSGMLPRLAPDTPGPTPTMMPGRPGILDSPPPPRGLLSPGAESNAPMPGAQLSGNEVPMPYVRPSNPALTPPTFPARMPEFNPGRMSRSDEYYGAMNEVLGRPTGRVKGILLGAGLGALKGLATGQGLAAGAGGGIVGGIAGGVSPRTARAQQFNMFTKPRMLERWQLEDMDAARTRQQQDDMTKGRLGQAQLDLIGSQTEQNRANAERLRLPPAPRQQPTRQPRLVLGINTQTNEPDYYDPTNPEDRKLFKPYIRQQQPRTTRTPRQATRPASATKAAEDANKKKRAAEQLWKRWGETPEGEARTKLERQARAAQGDYNAAVSNLGTLYGDWFETGEGQGGWGYYKPRQGGQAQQRGAKATVNQGFINFVMRAKGITDPEEARRMIEDDGYIFGQPR